MIFGPLVAAVCTKVLGWLMFITAGLLGLLTVTQWLRADAFASPASQMIGAVAAVVVGAALLWLSRQFSKAAGQ